MKQLISCNNKINQKATQEIFKKYLNTDISSIIKISGGCAKYTYKVITNNHDNTYLFQIWENPFKQLDENNIDEINLLYGTKLIDYINNYSFLLKNNINTPKIIHYDYNNGEYQNAYLITEYINGPSYNDEYLSENDRMEMCNNLGEQIGRLHSHKRDYFGKIDDQNILSNTCHNICYRINEKNLEISCIYDSEIRNKANEIKGIIDCLYKNLKDNNFYNLIHADLSETNIVFDKNKNAYFIDIDSLLYFDIEYNYSVLSTPCFNILNNSFLNIYNNYITPEINTNKIKFYTIYHYISWISFFSDAVFKKIDNFSRLEIYLKNTKMWLFDLIKKI